MFTLVLLANEQTFHLGVPKGHRRAAHENTCKCEGQGKKGASPFPLPLMVAKTPPTHALSWLALLAIIGELVHRLVLACSPQIIFLCMGLPSLGTVFCPAE